MKITRRILCVPPYISTTWRHIAVLHMQEKWGGPILIVDLKSGHRIEIPHLDATSMEKIFSMHASYNENSEEMKRSSDEIQKKTTPSDLSSFFSIQMPDRLLGEMEKIAGVLQHNPEAADSADLPREMLDNIATVAQSLGGENIAAVPHPVSGCNCFFCQIARTIACEIHPITSTVSQQEEEVSEDDLRFKNWDILKKDSHLYEVVNPLDSQEYYTVFLGEPVGCTCGHPHCEHIHAVLNS